MEVDKAGCHRQAGHVENPIGVKAARRADFDNTVAANQDIGRDGRAVVAAEYVPTGQQNGGCGGIG